jgi:hypothetical protein
MQGSCWRVSNGGDKGEEIAMVNKRKIIIII